LTVTVAMVVSWCFFGHFAAAILFQVRWGERIGGKLLKSPDSSAARKALKFGRVNAAKALVSNDPLLLLYNICLLSSPSRKELLLVKDLILM
jgi:hypothetical protein